MLHYFACVVGATCVLATPENFDARQRVLAAGDTIQAVRTNKPPGQPIEIAISSLLEGVALPRSSDGVGADEIHMLAQSTRTQLAKVLQRTEKKQRWLGLNLGFGSGLVTVGQYAGGGGAAVFGLQAASSSSSASESQNKGRNAAYAGAVAAGVTALKDLFKLDEKKKARDACAELRSGEFGLMQQTYSWDGQAKDTDFQATFLKPGGPYEKFNSAVDSYAKKCLQ